MRPILMQDSNMIAKQFKDIEDVVENICDNKDWTADDCQIILGADFNTNLYGDAYRNTSSIVAKLGSEH